MIYGLNHSSVNEYADKLGIEYKSIKRIDREYKEGDTLLIPNFAYICNDGARGCVEKIEELLSIGVEIIATDHRLSASNAICEALHVIADIEDVLRSKWNKDYNKWLKGVRTCDGDNGGYFDVYGKWRKGVIEEYEKTKSTPLERQVDWQENSVPSEWIDTKILDGWSAPLIINELKLLHRLLPSVFVSYTGSPISANYINTRKKHLIG